MIQYEIKPINKFTFGWKELWQFRELFYFFTWRDIKVKYKQTILGFAWAVLQPLIMMLLFTLILGRAFNIPSDNIPYPVFVFSGLLLWNIFATGITGAGNSMVTNAHIIKKIYFPRLIIPLSSILVSLFDFVMAFIIYIFILIYFNSPFHALQFIFCFPFALLITLMTSFGTGTLLAALNVKYRDFRHVIPFLVQSLFFITPVIYPVSIIQNKTIQILLSINPMTAAIGLFRSALTGILPSQSIIITGMFSGLILLTLGIYYFRKTEAYFADVA